MQKQSILIIDDEVLILDTMSKDLAEEGYRVDTAINGEEGIKKFEDNYYDLVIVDLVMPGIRGIRVAQLIKEIKSDTKIIFLTGFGSIHSAIEALRLEASDYFLKPYNRKDLSEKVAICLEELKSSNQKLVGLLASNAGEKQLSSREVEVAQLLFEGLSDREISSRLFISLHTVKSHLKHIYKKLGLGGRTKLLKLKLKS